MATRVFKFVGNARHKDLTSVNIIDLKLDSLDDVDDRLIRARYISDKSERQQALSGLASSDWLRPWAPLGLDKDETFSTTRGLYTSLLNATEEEKSTLQQKMRDLIEPISTNKAQLTNALYTAHFYGDNLASLIPDLISVLRLAAAVDW